MKKENSEAKAAKADKRKVRGFYLSDEAVERILDYAKKNHLSGGVSGALEYIAFHLIPDDTNI